MVDNKVRFLHYWRALSPSEKLTLCNTLGTSRTYFSTLAHGGRKPSKWLDLALKGITGHTFIYEHEIQE